MSDGSLTLSSFQQKVLGVPEELDLALLGGRGGGKSFTLLLLAWRHLEQHRERARVVYLRSTHRACLDFGSMALEWFARAYGSRTFSYNAQESIFKLPGGGTLELNQIESESDLTKFLGRSFSLLLLDEAGEFPTPVLTDRLRGNLRAPAGVAVRTALAANPGGPGHSWLSRRYAFKTPWVPFLEETSGREYVLCPSTLEDNAAIDKTAYRRQLEAATATDPELRKAWVDGVWSIARGAFFAACLDERRVAIDPWPSVPMTQGKRWRTWLAYDHGSSAPAVCFLVAKSPGGEVSGRWFPRDSLVVLAELAVCDPLDINAGLQWPVPKIADAIKSMCKEWGVRPTGAADPAIFAVGGHGSGSIASEFLRLGVAFRPSANARIAGWTKMRRMFADAGASDRPGLYVTRTAELFWQTAPVIGRDPRRIEDIDTRQNDHALDALRYGVVYEEPIVRISDMAEHWGTPRRQRTTAKELRS